MFYSIFSPEWILDVRDAAFAVKSVVTVCLLVVIIAHTRWNIDD
jgi:hypothetical protein